MITGFDRISVAVPDMEAAIAEFQMLSGRNPIWCGDRDDRAIAWFGFANCIVECIERQVDKTAIEGLVFLSDDLDGDLISNAELLPLASGEAGLHFFASEKVRNISVGLTDGTNTIAKRSQQDILSDEVIQAVDHVVLNTVDGDDCIRLFGDGGLGIRLALDQRREEWGGRQIFFRTGSMSLEIIESLDPEKKKGRTDQFWGIAFRVSNIDLTYERLLRMGVTISDIRDGRKEGTRVATVKSHNLGLPTLLIEHAVR